MRPGGSMRLFIAEKPSLGRAIAEVLPGPHERKRHAITCGSAEVVAWCAGHILEPAPPEAYDDAYRSWRLEDLPISPGAWRLECKAPELLTTIERLLRRATRVVHAGDPDREGQLLVDEVLAHLGYDGPVERLLVRDLRPEGVREALGRLEPNTRFRPLSAAALARQRADWLYGMNMTRLYTVLGRNGGHDGVLSVGRVQTPLLGLIVRRDREIAAFAPRPYFVIAAQVQAAAGELRVVWKPGPAHQAALDEDGRLVGREVAEAVVRRTVHQAGVVVGRSAQRRSEPPPLPYALADLQVEAGRRLGLSAASTLEACQSLYEQHRLTTYPRSDCPYLPAGYHAEARAVCEAIGALAPDLSEAAAACETAVRSRAFDDARVGAHHAIIPTPGRAPSGGALSECERAVYTLIARRYLMQFLAASEHEDVEVEIEVQGERFAARGRAWLVEGWRALETRREVEAEEGADGEAAAAPLPPVSEGEIVRIAAVDLLEKKTQPPKAFTDASLIRAMCNIARYVSDPTVKQILREADGIGTPATRAAIIETLVERKFVERRGPRVVSTPTGQRFVAALPALATSPDLTAVWEAAMRRILEGEQTLEAFLARVEAQLRDLIGQGTALGRLDLGDALPCPNHGCPGVLSRGAGGACGVCQATAAGQGTAQVRRTAVAPARRRGRPGGQRRGVR